MRSDAFATVAAIVLTVLLLAISISCGMAGYNECRRYHPWWYCM